MATTEPRPSRASEGTTLMPSPSRPVSAAPPVRRLAVLVGMVLTLVVLTLPVGPATAEGYQMMLPDLHDDGSTTATYAQDGCFVDPLGDVDRGESALAGTLPCATGDSQWTRRTGQCDGWVVPTSQPLRNSSEAGLAAASPHSAHGPLLQRHPLGVPTPNRCTPLALHGMIRLPGKGLAVLREGRVHGGCAGPCPAPRIGGGGEYLGNCIAANREPPRSLERYSLRP